MNMKQVIELDNLLDQVIMTRAENLAQEIEFANTAEPTNKLAAEQQKAFQGKRKDLAKRLKRLMRRG